MSENIKPIYIDLESGKRIYLNRPLNSQYNKFFYETSGPSRVWTVNHNQDSNEFIINIFDKNGNKIIPDKVFIEDTNTIAINFNINVEGYCYIIFYNTNIMFSTPTPTVTFTPTITPSITPTITVTPSI